MPFSHQVDRGQLSQGQVVEKLINANRIKKSILICGHDETKVMHTCSLHRTFSAASLRKLSLQCCRFIPGETSLFFGGGGGRFI